MSKNDSKQQQLQKQENKQRQGSPAPDKKLDGINKPST
ncbi:hypothetical protein E6C60_0623 [Paenibacillus algicola]|uniref:Uncharacterized protein n=1 Tax=Paenibacillus algicola TaxID=2565926 RepID=A0A4P8XGB6_9BACL|nr:hypothetical protein E6C60_0623 [Paenibacillus algicola]